MCTKAIHLELVTALTTAAFIATLRRFFSRRGISHEILSDNATNFRGADRELQELRRFVEQEETQDHINSILSSHYCKWQFVPPYSPHLNGLAEANIKVMKLFLRKNVTPQVYTYEELLTLLCSIESCLNSRPLCSIQEGDHVKCLTPGHFLIGEALTALPEPNYNHINISHLNRWQNLLLTLQKF